MFWILVLLNEKMVRAIASQGFGVLIAIVAVLGIVAPRNFSIEREITIKIPAGIEDGMTMRVAGEGEAGENGAPSGDLLCDVHIKPHPLFKRAGADVYLVLPVGFAQAALGAAIEVPTLKGKAELKISRGTQSGQVLRMRGEGFSKLDGYGKGDQLVEIAIEVPAKLTKEQEKLLREFAETEEQNISPERKSFLDKVRKMFSK